MILGILPSLGGSIESQRKDGREGLFLNYYIPAYSKNFDKIFYFSYAHESETNNPAFAALKNTQKLHRYLYAFAMPFVYQKQIRECSILRVMHTNGAIPAMISKLLWRVPFVTTYGYDYVRFARIEGHPIKAYLIRLVLPILLRAADGIIVTTEDLKRDVAALIGDSEKIKLVPNGTDTKRFSPLEKPTNNPTFKFLFVGRLEKQKNISFLFDVISKIAKTHAIELVMIGNGSLRNELEARATQENLPITFLGSISYEKIPQYHQQSDCFISTSLAEGHPKALIEAMSSGLACAVSQSRGNTALIQHEKNGLLLSLESIDDWVSQLERIIRDLEFRRQLGRHAREWIVQNLDLQKTLSNELSFVYSKVIRN